jgi:hypothetical protein
MLFRVFYGLFYQFFLNISSFLDHNAKNIGSPYIAVSFNETVIFWYSLQRYKRGGEPKSVQKGYGKSI